MLKNKKGIALNQAFGAILTIVLVAILVIIAIFLFVNLQGTFVSLASASATNETVSMASGANTIANNSLCNFAGASIAQVWNGTSDVLLVSTNYSISGTGTVTNLTNEYPNDWRITSSGVWGGEACDATQGMITQFATYPTLIGLVGTIIFLGLVIGVLVASFVFGRKGAV